MTETVMVKACLPLSFKMIGPLILNVVTILLSMVLNYYEGNNANQQMAIHPKKGVPSQI